MIYSSLIVHLHLKWRETRLSVMCRKLSFIVHGQRKEKERGAFDDRFFFFLRNTTFVSSTSLIVHKNFKLIDPFNVSLIDAVSKYAI